MLHAPDGAPAAGGPAGGAAAPQPPFDEQDAHFMRLALREAAQAAQAGEVPVGAVIARQGQLLAAAANRRERDGDALSHAECLAIRQACAARGGWQLWDCTLYVTLEPCAMCAGAILNSRIQRVVFAAHDPKAGCCGSLTDLFALPGTRPTQVEGGLLEEDSAQLLRRFFGQLRARGARWQPPRKEP